MMDSGRLGKLIKGYKKLNLMEKWGCGAFVWEENTTVTEIEEILKEVLFNPLKEWRCLNWRTMCQKYDEAVIAEVMNHQMSAYGWRLAHVDDTTYNERRDMHLLESESKYCEEFDEYDLVSNLTWSEEMGQWINANLTEDFRFCEDIEEWMRKEDCFYCEFTGNVEITTRRSQGSTLSW